MPDRTKIRTDEIRRRTRLIRNRRDKRAITSLYCISDFLFADIFILLRDAWHPSIVSVSDIYGAVLLREEACNYVVVGIASFIIGMALTLLLSKLHKIKHSKTENKREEKV